MWSQNFSVASVHEAEEVMNVCSPSSSIMIMGIMYDEDLPWAFDNEIEFYVFDTTRLEKILNAAKKVGKKAKIHLEVETGANRTGLIEASFKKTLTFIKKNKEHFSFEGLCTHFGGAESLSNEFKVSKQFKRFQWYYKECKIKNFLPKLRHMASSAATFMYPESHYEMVRVGVAQYGFWPSPDIYYHHLSKEEKQYENGLKRVFSWKTDVMDIRTVKEEEFIGYGTAYQATHEMRVAVLPLGYSNGYPRAQSNRGHVLIQGKKAPIVGLINMNLFMVDVTHISNAEIGDEVVLFGR
jgi:alanine racemase